MPIYEYKCPNCGYRFDELLLSEDDKSKVPACPGCRTVAIRQLSAVGLFQINGYNEANGYS